MLQVRVPRHNSWSVVAAVVLALPGACQIAVNGLEAIPGDDAGGDASDASASDVGTPGKDGAADGPQSPGAPDFAWYLLNETSGTTAHDSTPNHYDVTNLLGVTWGNGASFDGTGGGGSVVVAAGLRQAPVSFTAWLAPDSRVDEGANGYGITPFPPNAVSGDVLGEFGYGIGLNVWSGGSALAVEDVGSDFQSVGGAAFVVAVEYFITAAIGVTNAAVYVNGQIVGEGTPSLPGPSATTSLAIGFHDDNPAYGTKRFYAGRIRDVRIYKRALTSAEAMDLYTSGPATMP